MVLRRDGDADELAQHRRRVGVVIHDQNGKLLVVHTSILVNVYWHFREGISQLRTARRPHAFAVMNCNSYSPRSACLRHPKSAVWDKSGYPLSHFSPSFAPDGDSRR